MPGRETDGVFLMMLLLLLSTTPKIQANVTAPPPTPAPTARPTPAPTVFCGRGEYLDGSSCEPCEAGKYRNVTTAPAVCTTCEAGKYRAFSSDPSNAHTCESCPDGTLSSADRSLCTQCSAGEYAFNDISCETCPAGTYAPTAQEDACLDCGAGFFTAVSMGATTCSSCDAGLYSAALSVNCSTCAVGKYSSSRSETCTVCASGEYSSVEGASTCTACAAGYAQPSNGSSSCEACEAGQYQSATGQDVCESCMAGMFSSSKGSSSCESCDAGTYSVAAAANCSACSAGTFSSSGASACDDCPAGRYSDADTGFSCESCDAGTYSAAAAANCSACSAGKYSGTGASACTVCAAGFYSAGRGSSACTACGAGQAQPSNGSSACADCGLGTYQSATGQTSCERCEAGQFAASMGLTTCTSCDAGTYSNSSASSCEDCEAGTNSASGASSCTDCSAGRYSNAGTGFSCESCDAGTYSSSGASECLDCAEGNFSFTGASSCTACEPGRYSNTETGLSCESCDAGRFSTGGAVNCSACPAGTFSNTGSSRCTNCVEEYYSPDPGASSCLKCSTEDEYGSAYTSVAGASECSVCVAGYYKDMSGECVACPDEGVDCGSDGSVLASLEVESHWFRFTNSSTEVYECTYPAHCLGGNSTAHSQQCREGSTGPLCSVCSSRYYLDSLTETCTSCDDVNGSGSLTGLGAILAILFVLVGTYFGLKWYKSRLRLRRQSAARQLEHHTSEWVHWQQKQDIDIVRDTAGVFITTTQTIILLLDNHENAGGEEAPQVYDKYIGFWGFLELDFLAWLPGVGCAFKGFEYDLLFQTMGLALAVILAVLHFAYKRGRGDTDAWLALKRSVQVCKFVLPAVSQTIASTFRCESYDDGRYTYLLADHSIDCDGQLYHDLQLFGLLMVLVFPVGLPLCALVALRRLEPYFQAETQHPELERALNPELATSPLLPLFDRYRPFFASWFEVANMLRRLALVCGTLIFSRVSTFILFSISVACLSAVLHEHLQPYNHRMMNALASAEHWQNLLVIIMLLINDAAMFDAVSFETVGIALLGTNVGMMLVIFAPLWPSESPGPLALCRTVCCPHHPVSETDAAEEEDFDSVVAQVEMTTVSSSVSQLHSSSTRVDLPAAEYRQAGQSMYTNATAFASTDVQSALKAEVGNEHLAGTSTGAAKHSRKLSVTFASVPVPSTDIEPSVLNEKQDGAGVGTSIVAEL